MLFISISRPCILRGLNHKSWQHFFLANRRQHAFKKKRQRRSRYNKESGQEGNPCDWRYVMDVNVISLALFAKETVRSVQSRGQEGHIIFIGSVGGHVLSPKEDLHFYMVSKHAVTALTEAFRQELVARKLPIKISKVCPGYVQTDFNVHMFEHHKDKDKKIASYYPKIKMLQPSDIADAILYILATPPHVQVNDVLIRSVEELI